MILQGYQGLGSNPHLVLVPGLALTLLALSFNFMGDGLRDALDPRMHRR
jgi:ABC-type dipeptide/oligopeptide/nickel transport system permease subunit